MCAYVACACTCVRVCLCVCTLQEMNSMPLYGSWLVSVLPHCTSLCALATFRSVDVERGVGGDCVCCAGV